MRSTSAVVLGAILLGAGSAHANDLTFGGDARAFSMGGAGVASLAGAQSSSLGGRSNPASLAFANKGMRFHFPNIGVRADGGITLNKAASFLLNSDSGSDAASLARRFTSEDSTFGLNVSTGLRLGPIEVLTTGVAKGYLLPNTTFKNWSNSGVGGSVPANSQVDVVAAAVYSLPQIGFAVALPQTSKDAEFQVGVGARLKYMNAIYAHYVADQNILNNGGTALRAPEMNGKDSLTQKGFGADLGVVLESRKVAGLSGGLVVANAIKPSFRFTGQFSANANGGGGTRVYDLLATTASAGVGYVKNGTTVVADWVDVTGAAGATQLRAGAEQRLGPIAVRAGYNTANGVTYGLGLFGFDIAFGQRQALEVVRTLRF